MKYFRLIWSSLWRKKLRTLFTMASIMAAFVLYGVLSAVQVAFSMGIDLAGADRLVLIHKVSMIQPLPIAYLGRIEAVPGVSAVAHSSWFGGYYQDPSNFFAQFPVDPESYLEMFPEFVLDEAAKEAWIANRTGAIVGSTTAEQFGFKVGDRIPITGSPWEKKDGSNTWEFDIDGIYTGADKGTDTTQFLFHYDYFDEARRYGEGQVGWYTIRIDDPDRAAEIAADIDSRFANSPAETKTTTEKAFAQAFANQVGNIPAIVRSIVGAVFAILLLVAGNSMAQSVRERVSELAVMKTLGFSDGKVLGLILGESLLIAGLGGFLGLGLSWLVVGGVASAVSKFLPIFYLAPKALITGLGLVLVLGIVAGLLPALQAKRLSIVDALRRG
ncbi:MAG: FtsX-like permease family protein [Thermoanaerobaculia bacterium]|nr:FtsX-like permease family protein [Thermoanaerobaculia bacterium]